MHALLVVPWMTVQLLVQTADPSLELLKKAGDAYNRGEFRESLKLHQQALEIEEKALPANHPVFAYSHHNVGVLLCLTGQPKKALPHLQKACDIRKPAGGELFVSSLLQYASALRTLKRPIEAEPIVREAIAVMEAPPLEGSASPQTVELRAMAYNTLGALHIDLQDPEGAERMMRRALAALPADRMEDFLTLRIRANLAAAIAAQGRFPEALGLFRATIPELEMIYGKAHPVMKEVERSYTNALRSSERSLR